MRRGHLAHQRTTSGALRVPMNVHTAASIVLAQTLNVESHAVETIPPTLPTQHVPVQEGTAPALEHVNTLYSLGIL